MHLLGSAAVALQRLRRGLSGRKGDHWWSAKGDDPDEWLHLSVATVELQLERDLARLRSGRDPSGT